MHCAKRWASRRWPEAARAARAVRALRLAWLAAAWLVGPACAGGSQADVQPGAPGPPVDATDPAAPADPVDPPPAQPAPPLPGDEDDVIPPQRRTDWRATGVPGGIPARTRVCASFAPGASAASINAALASPACAEAVVQLAPGTYRLTGLQVYASHVTLRGAGADQTVLQGCNAVRLGSGGPGRAGIAITGGGAQGSRTVTVASKAGLAVGRMIELDRDDEAGWVVSTAGGSRHMRQVNVVTGISGNELTLRNPLLWNFGAGNPQLKFIYTATRRSGVEDLRIDHSGAGGCTNFVIQYCDSCWIKGVDSYLAAGYHFTMLGTVNGEFRDSAVRLTQTYGPDNAGLQAYGSPTYGSNSSWRIENNIFDRLFPAIELQNASSGFYVGYNFSHGSASQPGPDAQQPVTWTFADNHGPHDMMNLWEGNVGEMFGSDGYYGSSSHATVFRNHLVGVNRNSGQVGEPVRLNRLSHAYNLVGNVLGASSWVPAKYEQAADNCAGGVGVYRLGYPNIGNCLLHDTTGLPVPGGMRYPDGRVKATLLRWGNYDSHTRAVRWEAGELPAGVAVPATRALRASYVHEARPAWFGPAAAWPPIGPEVTGGTAWGEANGRVHGIPAQQCWQSRNLGAGGSFSRAACYPGN